MDPLENNIQNYIKTLVEKLCVDLANCMDNDFYKFKFTNTSGNFYLDGDQIKYKFSHLFDSSLLDAMIKTAYDSCLFPKDDYELYYKRFASFFETSLNKGVIQAIHDMNTVLGISQNVFFPVGQGLFQAAFLFSGFKDIQYKLEIKLSGGCFLFEINLTLIPHHRVIVYDCGGNTSAVKNSLNEFNHECKYFNIDKAVDGRNIVELFTLSHFDKDHRSGLFELTKLVMIKHFMFPFHDAITRVINVLKDLDSPPSTINDQFNDSIDFLMNPLGYLQEHNVANDYLIAVESPIEADEKLHRKLKDVCLGMDPEDFLRNIDVQIDDQTFGDPTNVYHISIDAVHRNVSTLQMGNYWQMCLIHYREVDIDFETRKNDLTIKIKEVLGIPKDVTNEEMIAAKITEAMKEKTSFAKIKYIYKTAFSGAEKSNIISLSMYFENISKYPSIKMRQRNVIGTNSVAKHYIRDINCSKCLLTGDTNFNGKVRVDAVETTIVTFLHGVLAQKAFTPSLVSVPHHGAEHNWKVNNEFFNGDINWVVSYGKDNPHRHPHKSVASLFGSHYLPIYYTYAVAPTMTEPFLKDTNGKKPEPIDFYPIKDPMATPTLIGFDPLLKNTLFHCNDKVMVIFII